MAPCHCVLYSKKLAHLSRYRTYHPHSGQQAGVGTFIKNEKTTRAQHILEQSTSYDLRGFIWRASGRTVLILNWIREARAITLYYWEHHMYHTINYLTLL